MKKWMGAFVGILAFLILLTAVAGRDRKLAAEVIVERSDIGIPGITKTYFARLRNTGALPSWITRCEAIDDAMGHETFLAYNIERWDNEQRKWVPVTHMSDSFCKPAPLSIISAKLTRKRLWPGQTLDTNWEATAARDVFKIGDHARFLIYPDGMDNPESFVASPPFRIDETPTVHGLRIAH
jgi:hypothetical protein